jgi:hypothetical protein
VSRASETKEERVATLVDEVLEFTGDEKDEGPPPIEADKYLLQVTDAKVNESQATGRPYVRATLKVVEDHFEGKYRGRTVFHTIAFIPGPDKDSAEARKQMMGRAQYTYRTLTGESFQAAGTLGELAREYAAGIRGGTAVGNVKVRGPKDEDEAAEWESKGWRPQNEIGSFTPADRWESTGLGWS